MRQKLTILAVFLFLATPCMAGLADIDKSKLPPQPAILKAYEDVMAVEEMVREWSDKWRFSTPKAVVVARLQESLETLRKARGSTPDNLELALLTGLVAHYAYNLEIEGAYEVAEQSFATARKLLTTDYRPEWFLGIHLCQANRVDDGMNNLLSVEQSFAPEKMSPAFWDDYLYCAHLANMPAHELHAANRIEKTGAPPSKDPKSRSSHTCWASG